MNDSEMNMGKKLLAELLKNKKVLICGGLALASFLIVVWLIVDYFIWTKKSEDKMEALRIEAEQVAISASDSQGEDKSEVKTEVESIVNPYTEIFAQNEDMAAWLSVADTKMDYPVMQTMENETYYIDKDFYGNPDKAGCLLLDTDSSLEQEGTTNLIIHGHNMKAGTMFGELEKYQEEEYGKAHKDIVLYTLGDKREYQVISAFYSQVFYQTDTCFKYYNFFEAKTEDEFLDFYDNIKSMSLYDTGVTAELGDSFITLSTCSYHVEDGRFVVIAKEVNREQYE